MNISKVTVSDDRLHFDISREDAHALRVALRPVRAGETVSKSTQDIRDRLDRALARIDTQPKRKKG